MLKIGDTLKGKYKILTQIGRGGMGKVWLAMDMSLNKQWAVKEIDKTSAEYKLTVNEDQTLTEIELMKRLDHPLLPRIVDVIDKKASLCVVMDYIEGVPLTQILRLQGAQPQEMVVAWMMEICEVLEYLHGLDPPIIYRDMKPANIMLKPDGTIRVIDFGIARTYKEGLDDTMCLGTKGYASPEHFIGKTDVRSDVYTVGVTMYQLLTGKNPALPPYEVLPIREVNPALSSGLEKIIQKATDLNPEKRYQSARKMRSDLAGYKKLEEPYIRAVKKKMKTFRLLIASGLCCLLIASGLFIANNIVVNNTYEELVASENPDIRVRAEELQKAITIRPERADAYIKLIEAYAKDGFTESEATQFLSAYNSNRKKVEGGGESYAELNFEIGQAFLLYYTGATDNSDRNRLITAAPFFKEAQADGYSKAALAKGYADLADFYQRFIIGSSSLVAQEAGKEEYEEFLSVISALCQNVEGNEAGSVQLQMVTYDLIFTLLDDSRQGFCKAGFAQEQITDVVSGIVDKAKSASTDVQVTEEKRQLVLLRGKSLIDRIQSTYEMERKKEGGI